MIKIIKEIPAFFTFTLKLMSVFAMLFFCTRVLFVLFNNPSTNHESVSVYFSAFFMGLRFDLIIASYLLLLPALVLFTIEFFKENKKILLSIRVFLILVSVPALFIACADIPYFSQFGSHINKSVMVWSLSPGYALKLIFSSFYYWGFSLAFLVLFVFYWILIRKLFLNYTKNKLENTTSLKKKFLFFLVLAFILFAFARGRLASKSTMHEGMAIVSQNAFVNQIALNANFTLIKSLGRKETNKEYLKNIASDLKICSAFYSLNYFPKEGVLNEPIVSTAPADSINKLNVIIVLMESLNMSKMGYYNHKNLSPYLNSLAKESVFFDRFFSSGIHTFNGLFSTTTGFPSIYTEQGLREYTKRPFTTLTTLLKPYGYHSYFCTTHDAVFDNMEGFFKLNGYENIISESDFSITESVGVTGVPDHLLYKKLIERINKNEKNSSFVACVMTGTDHGPWHIPVDIDFKPSGSSFQENASLYADWAVQQFMLEAKKQDWYQNTVFVFLGDHGQIMDDPYAMPITYHHTPFIVHCPMVLQASENHHLGYQPDVVRTISSVLKLNYPNFSFGENILEKSRPFVFFSADDKLGFVTDDDLFFYHTFSDDQKKVVRYRELGSENIYEGNRKRADSLYALTQSLYNSAQYYLHKNYKSD
ncbi:LTA synthase family protein [Aurantibacillus circumpalustris]|uniref:LTA synthase family protein n=1 Tax=Aurantibacillus circumpalustris TaxID=3036359 RepID=UPI00295AC62F|nr:sulfatase-like hydrolase/transferase [Aurantibacillus circumpalustris]